MTDVFLFLRRLDQTLDDDQIPTRFDYENRLELKERKRSGERTKLVTLPHAHFEMSFLHVSNIFVIELDNEG